MAPTNPPMLPVMVELEIVASPSAEMPPTERSAPNLLPATVLSVRASESAPVFWAITPPPMLSRTEVR